MEYVKRLEDIQPVASPESHKGAVSLRIFNKDTVGAESIRVHVNEYAPGGYIEADHHPPHIDREQVFYIISGTMAVQIEGKEYMAPAGSFVYVPRGAEHSHRNVGNDTLRFILVNSTVRSGEVPPPPKRAASSE